MSMIQTTRGHPFGHAFSLLVATLAALAVFGCDSGSGPAAPAGATLELSFSGLRPLDPNQEGSYEAWVIGRDGQAHSAGKFEIGGIGRIEVTNPVGNGVAIEITIEPPGDANPAPSAQRLLTGEFRGGTAELTVVGAVTASDVPLRENPGQWTVFTPSDNLVDPYPSHEYSGVWLFNARPRLTEQGDTWVRLTPLRDGWVYEGWAVRDFGTPEAVWLSYGKFVPDGTGAVDHRDDTGWGPFSGVEDFRTAGIEDFPGDDWIANPLDFPVPGNLELPIDLREENAAGEYRWTHIISVEPVSDRGEPLTTERPFLIQPYRDRYTDGGPGDPRIITFRPEDLPHGTARVQ